jgi:CDP-diacylglycerol--glycerol-3-phosphate 3-phosphatidyltransferase
MTITFANKITVLRILMVPAFIISVLYLNEANSYLKSIALGIFLSAAISDAVDGYIARKFDQQTRLGALLDPIADKFLLVSAFVCLFIMREQFGLVQLPFWLLIVIISRDIILMAGFLILHVLQPATAVKPTKAGKLTTVFQVLAVIGIFLQWRFSFVLWWVILILSVATTIDYITKNLQPHRSV